MSEPQEHGGLRLLSLDGGGIRGLSGLLILRQVMKRIQFQEKLKEEPLPCNYFDLIGGTSTGGIIAIMVGRLRMSVTRAIECYGTLAEKVFSDLKQPGGDGKFKASKLEEIIKTIVKEQTGQADERMMDMRSDGERCKTFVCAMGALNMSAGIPRLFRTYHAPKNETFNCTIWEAARATSAAPTFFKRIIIGEPGSSEPYIDGGMGRNNPIAQVLEEAELMFPGRQIACIVSIGTGQAQTISIPKPGRFQRVLPLDIVKAMQGIATDCERSAQEIARRFQAIPNIYFRFNVEQGLQNVGLAQWERLDEVTAHTEQYIRMAEVDQKLGAVVGAIRGRQEGVATALIAGTVRPSTHQKVQASIKICPPPTHVFTGRQDILSQMEEYFSKGLGKRHVFVLYGLGGAGKSQIAFKFVEHCQIETEPSRFSNVFFVDASTTETISADLESVALAKGVGRSKEDALGWLARQREEWLLLLNNADDTTLNLRQYFPLCSHGNILITSRNRDLLHHASGARSSCHVSRMNPDDARHLLLEMVGLGEEHIKEAAKIVKELGHLALAVVQAGAYISRTECGLNRYLDLYRERRGGLLEEYHDSTQKIDDYEWTVYTTWGISFSRLSEPAATFLQLCAFLHHDGISEAIFQNAAVNATVFVSDVPRVDQESDSLSKAKDFLGLFGALEAPWDTQKFLRIIGEIRSYSLIDFEAGNQSYSIHPLVHVWTRTTMSDGDVTRTSLQCVLGMSVNCEDDLEDRAFRRTLLPHVDAALQGGAALGPDILARLGLVYYEGGRWKEVEELDVQVTEAKERLLGTEHPDTLASMSNLAWTYQSQGRWKEAEELGFQVTEAKERVLGTEHPSTLASMSDLAWTYQSQGRWKEAEELGVQVTEARRKVLGEEHPHTLASMSDLAWTYQTQGRWKEAEELGVQVTEASERVLGAEHPDTLLSMSILVSTYRSQGRWKEAEELGVQVAETSERVLGAEHPDTLASMSSLASTYQSQGRWKEAGELGVQVTEARKRVLGAEHPYTLGSMSNLAWTYENQGRWKEAEELGVQVTEARRKVLGPEHPDTLGSMSNLALTYRSQGRWKEAEELGVQVTETREKVIGAEHPDTLASMSNLASTSQIQGRWKEAEELGVLVTEASERVLSTEHPDTLASMSNLAWTFQSQGRWKEAEALGVQVKEASERVLGPEHPDTLASMSNLASTYQSQGRWKEAEELGVQVTEARERVLGAAHPDTLASMSNLAVAYDSQGRWKEAEELRVSSQGSLGRHIHKLHEYVYGGPSAGLPS